MTPCSSVHYKLADKAEYPLRILKTSIRSALFRLSSNDHNPSLLRRSE